MTHDRNAANSPPVPRAGPSERPLTARSVLASALLGNDPPEMHVSQLVRLAGLFAINENRARVALSRMVASGEVSTDGNARYRLEGDLLARRARQEASLTGGPTDWDGTWWTVVLTGPAASADVRADRRAALRRARLGELRDGVWMRPADVDLALPAHVTDLSLTSRGTPLADGAALAARLWDLTGWTDHAHDLLRRLDRTRPTDASVLAPGFVLSASVLRHLQADPLLPAPLLPEDWPGRRLREVYADWDRSYRAQLADWHRAASGSAT